ncbi:hypothetical protein PORCAN_1950 [Porphyromonas crevioricanis JCM 13913]|nr:hypothetical protein PORCAN_1950 [Porphyromonas crevioricanis JCM 13913]
MALEALREVINNGAEVKTEKIDIHVDQNGTLRGEPQVGKMVKTSKNEDY